MRAITTLAFAGFASFVTGLSAAAEERIAAAFAAAARGAPASERSFKECDVCPEMVAVPGGTFSMGAPAKEDGRVDDETQRSVTVSAFAASRYEVTWDEWDGCVRSGGCGQDPETDGAGDNGWGKGRRPVIEVSWHDAQAYVGWLNRQVPGNPYRLLTEAEWEYAARAGTKGPFSISGRISDRKANYNATVPYGRSRERRSRDQTVEVGSFEPNAFGLYDVHGNVWEWTQDCYGEYANAPRDGGAATGAPDCARVMRGGSWVDMPHWLRSAIRGRLKPTDRISYIGFRVARTVS